MTPDHPLNRGEADSRSLELVGRVQTLESTEQLVGITHVEAHPVVSDTKGAVRPVFRDTERDVAHFLLGRVFPGVIQKIFQGNPQQWSITPDGEPVLYGDLDLPLGLGLLQSACDVPGQALRSTVS